IERVIGCRIIPTFRFGEIDEVLRTAIVCVFAVDGFYREFLNIAGIRNPDLVGSESFGCPQPFTSGKFNKDPSFVFVRKEMRITAVGCVSVFVDQIAEYGDSFFSSRGALHGDARKVGVLRSSLPVLGQIAAHVKSDRFIGCCEWFRGALGRRTMCSSWSCSREQYHEG